MRSSRIRTWKTRSARSTRRWSLFEQFIPLAEKHGLYLLLTPYDTFWQAKNWGAYPYNGELGGPCPRMSDWLTGEACIEAQKDRWRFIIDHWGGSPNIFAWDLMNEIDIWWNATPQEIETYVDDMAAFVRDYETEKWGRAHMISVSSAESVPTGRLGRVIFNASRAGFRQHASVPGAGHQRPAGSHRGRANHGRRRDPGAAGHSG